MPAKTLEEAYNILDHRQPVTPMQVEQLFVRRQHSPVDKMRVQLELSNRPLKLLFVGHRGAGKSSELAYLATLLDSKFLSVFTPLYDIFKGPAVSHTEVIFAMTLRLLKQATDESLMPRGLVTEGWEKLLEKIYEPLRQFLFGAQSIPADSEATISLKISVLVAELEAKIGTESYTRNQVKEKFEGRITDLLEQIGDLCRLMEGKLGRKLLLVVEDLDKFNLQNIRTLFLENARTLTAPYPSVIYTFPVELRYENSFRQIELGFDKAYLLPNISLTLRDGTENPEGRETMQNIFQKRVDPALFATGTVENLISLSGGHVKTFIQLGQQAVLNAVVDRQSAVAEAHLQQARRALRDDYVALLKLDQLRLLQQLWRNTEKELIDTNAAKLELLANLSLLEYGNTRGPWANVNPIVVELLERDWS